MRPPRLIVVICALGFWACGRASEPSPAAPTQAPAASSPADLMEQAPAAAPPAPEPAKEKEESAPRESTMPEGSFAQPPKDDLSSAEAELERARAELNDALPSSKRRARAAPTAGAPAAASRGAAADEAPSSNADKKASESSCPTACHAFSSLKRAATAVCRLAGEKDGRCSHAHGVVADAEKRVTVCGCSAG